MITALTFTRREQQNGRQLNAPTSAHPYHDPEFEFYKGSFRISQLTNALASGKAARVQYQNDPNVT
jgi:hypothetical protein